MMMRQEISRVLGILKVLYKDFNFGMNHITLCPKDWHCCSVRFQQQLDLTMFLCCLLLRSNKLHASSFSMARRQNEEEEEEFIEETAMANPLNYINKLFSFFEFIFQSYL
ncbi:unnamed protein product [Brassica oleracea]